MLFTACQQSQCLSILVLHCHYPELSTVSYPAAQVAKAALRQTGFHQASALQNRLPRPLQLKGVARRSSPWRSEGGQAAAPPSSAALPVPRRRLRPRCRQWFNSVLQPERMHFRSKFVSRPLAPAVRPAAMDSTGDIPALLWRLRTSGTVDALQQAIEALDDMACSQSPQRCQAIVAASGVRLLVRLQRSGRGADLSSAATAIIASVASGSGAEACQAVAAAGGIPVLVQLVYNSDSSKVQASVARALINLAIGGGPDIAAAIAATG